MKIPDKFTKFYTYDLSDPPRYHNKKINYEYFDWLFSILAGTGLTFMYRCNLAGRAYYHSNYMAHFDHSCVEHKNPDADMWHKVAYAIEGCDPFAEAVRAAKKHKVPVWAWVNWNEFQCIRKDWLYLIDPVWYEKPRKYWCNRDGSRFYHGVPAFGDKEVVNRLLGIAAEVADYGVEGVYLSTRSHSWNACYPTPGWDKDLPDFGFNDCVVDAYWKKFGKDIRYDDFDEEEWNSIKGEQFSALLSRTGNLLHNMGKKFIVGVSPERYNLMVWDDDKSFKKKILLYKNWETWVKEGSIDGLCSEQTCPHGKKISGADIGLFKNTLPADFPIYTWSDTAWYENRGGGPFSLINWNRISTSEIMQQIDMAKQNGASGIVLHSLYHYTSFDSDGISLGGYGVIPRVEYLDALRSMR